MYKTVQKQLGRNNQPNDSRYLLKETLNLASNCVLGLDWLLGEIKVFYSVNGAALI